MDSDKFTTAKPPGDSFRSTLARAIGRIPSDDESRDAFARVRELLQVFDDIRSGRNGMRRSDAPVDNSKAFRPSKRTV